MLLFQKLTKPFTPVPVSVSNLQIILSEIGASFWHAFFSVLVENNNLFKKSFMCIHIRKSWIVVDTIIICDIHVDKILQWLME